MATGASTVVVACALVRAASPLMGTQGLTVPHSVIAVNKMDLVDYDEEVFRRIRAEFEPFPPQVGARDPYFLPLSALKGDNVADPSKNMPVLRKACSTAPVCWSISNPSRSSTAPSKRPSTPEFLVNLG